MNLPSLKKYAPVALAIGVVIAGLLLWKFMQNNGPGSNFVSGNGRIEAIEIDIATKMAGRIETVLVKEGQYIQAGQPLVQMQSDTLQAQRDEAHAREQQAIHSVASAQAQLAARLSDQAAAEAVVIMRESDLDAAQRRLARTSTLAKEGASSKQELDDDRARVKSMQATLNAAKAQVEAARAAANAANAQVTGAQAFVTASEATTKRIDADLKDSLLKAPRAARVQFVIAQEGEVLGAGGKVLNLVDLQDVYMSFFLPEAAAGKVNLGAQVRIVLDSSATRPLPATVTFISSTAQFTPKTVETASERQKLMFRVKAKIDQGYIDQNSNRIKTGMPGIAWLRLDANTPWPANLELKE
jgi:HlyD family secretion protein